MKSKIKKPVFPLKYVGEVNAFPWHGGIVVPNLIASIPIFTLYEGDERKQKEKEYWEEKQKELDEAIEFYSTINIGDVFCGSMKEVSLRISKISIKNDYLFINLCASEQTKKYCIGKGFKPPKSEKWRFEVFHSLVKSNHLNRLV